ncbi:MAG: hypothetical protein J6M46_08925 [Lachnospiraceae bacterium]|nr:hypothetical protein [Lachnospiraceae bacterium]
MKKISFNNSWTCNGQAVTLPHDAQVTVKVTDGENTADAVIPVISD